MPSPRPPRDERVGLSGTRLGGRATVAHGHFHMSVPTDPCDSELPRRKGVCVAQGIAQQFAHHQDRVVDRSLENPGGKQVGAEALARHCNARQSVRQHDDARRTHLPVLPNPLKMVTPDRTEMPR